MNENNRCGGKGVCYSRDTGMEMHQLHLLIAVNLTRSA